MTNPEQIKNDTSFAIEMAAHALKNQLAPNAAKELNRTALNFLAKVAVDLDGLIEALKSNTGNTSDAEIDANAEAINRLLTKYEHLRETDTASAQAEVLREAREDGTITRPTGINKSWYMRLFGVEATAPTNESDLAVIWTVNAREFLGV